MFNLLLTTLHQNEKGKHTGARFAFRGDKEIRNSSHITPDGSFLHAYDGYSTGDGSQEFGNRGIGV
ncbi:hypothetical protein [Nostoc parmelioides]|uniref:hypothetical protein n=1 Tax=Nostoc parmelioides TaxID=1521621 RepID=UPI00168803BA|nr:hypothetical protein [Nostoc parmelioides]